LQDINLFPKGTIDLTNGGNNWTSESKGGFLKGIFKH
jgi:hypothetical protein